MYIINLLQYAFKSKENIQPYIDQIILQSKLLEYSLKIYCHKNFYSDTPFIYYFYIRSNQFEIGIYFFTNHSNTLKKINFDYFNYFERKRYSKSSIEQNFEEVFTFLSQKL